jgi:hypothetical protein
MACAWFAEAATDHEPPSSRLAKRLIKDGAAGLIAPGYPVAAGPAGAHLIL